MQLSRYADVIFETMSFVKPRRNPVIAVSTNMTNSVARCCVPPVASLSSVSSSGNSTRFAVNLPHRTSGTADMPHISTMLGALSCSEDMRLLSPVSSTSLSHANGGSESRAGHLTSLSNLSYHARDSQGNHQQSSVSPHPDHLTCVNNGDGVYNSKGRISGPGASASMSDDSNTTCCGAHCGSSRSTCAMYEMSESSNDYECHLSNPEAICSPLLGTSNIWRFAYGTNVGLRFHLLVLSTNLSTIVIAKNCFYFIYFFFFLIYIIHGKN